MKRERRVVATLLFFVLIALLPRSASAWCQLTTCKDTAEAKCPRDEFNCQTTGTPLRWRKLPIHFRFSRLAPALLLREEARASIRAAFYRWSDTLCGTDQQ